MTTKRILVANTKGGCGKTTIATNIASNYAASGNVVRIFDHDNQNSSLQWVNRRSENISAIHGIDASRRPDNHMTRAWQLRVPAETDVVVIDTAAGLDVTELVSMFKRNDFLVIPVLPSPIDILATATFIKDVLLISKARNKHIKISVIANRVRKNTLMFHKLERFLFSLEIPFVTTLRDTQNYAKAIGLGIGIGEMTFTGVKEDQQQWAPLMRWLDAPIDSVEAEMTPTSSLQDMLSQYSS